MLTRPVSITGNQTHHYFALGGVEFKPIDCDDDGRVRVFLTREACEASARKKYGDEVIFSIAGMGDERWALFQREVKHRVIKSS